ncbi:hypothetical protein [Streptosporangium carneum]|uniref:Uncharacterized protein n=2 Tax=Streptosporangium carneum TaxID=47481 RepID=A0A9W6MFS6_9ACTN|nr:hypothetical protein [Streptosporangium carneum]GLK12193.1 hypothetical protein GCM10017600_56020 [Streptosporangium carneum]
MRTLDDLLEPLLGLDGRPAPLAGPLRGLLSAVFTRLREQLEQRAAQTPRELYLRGRDLAGMFDAVRWVPDMGLHRAVVAELADPASPLRVPLWIALGDLAGQLLSLLHRDGPRERGEEESRLVLGLVALLVGLTHPETRAGAEASAGQGGQDARARRSGEETPGQAPGAARRQPSEEAGEKAPEAFGRPRREAADRFGDEASGGEGGERDEPVDLVVRLRDEYDRLYQDSHLYLGEPMEAPATAKGLWIGLHVACLRLPDEIARAQREHFARVFAGAPGEGIVPPLPAIGFAGFGDVDRPEDGRWRSPTATRMYDILITMFAVAELDPRIYHGLDEMARDAGTPIRLDVGTRRQYQERAWTRLRELDDLPQGSDLEIRYLAWVDEAVSSFFPLPLPVPGSWWAERYRRSRALVLEAVKAAGGKVDILDGKVYDRALRRKLSGTPMILPVVDEADADRVMWTLRLPWEFNGSGEPGRVIYSVKRR